MRGIEFHAEIGSTNDRALQLAVDGATPLPWAVVAEHQTSGRGRGANRWWTGNGALTFSLLVASPDDPSIGPLPAQISLTAGLAVRAALREHVPLAEIQLKWPNDVYINGRKVCGILVEIPSAARGRAVIGIGINVNNSVADAPDELRATAISLADVQGSRLDRVAIIEGVLNALHVEWKALIRSPAGEPQSDLRERWSGCCYLTGRIVRLDSAAGSTTGLCLGIDSDGALLLQTELGPSRHTSGVVRRIES